ncbi:MAG: polysulfide reductase NrfD [Gammaproteobacteria bacterium]|nr:polysulfide reductase NrfD [Gammaproteobacteria bacterium]
MATSSNDLPIVGDSFRVGYRFQRYWDTPMANAFFCGELGAGIFLISAFADYKIGMLVGLLVTCILKTWFHLSHMGVPLKSWRAILRPDRSWISRGLMSIGFYAVFGFAYLGLTMLGLAESMGIPEALVSLTKGLAVLSALVVATYQGFAMSHSTAIALWNTGAMPISSLVYALAAGAMVTLVLGWNGFLADNLPLRGALVTISLMLLVAVVITLLSLLHAAHHGSPGGRKSVELLTKTFYSQWFYGITCGVGIALPALLLAAAGGSYAAVLISAAGVLAGYYSFRVLIFKAGLFEPIMSFRP